MPTRVEVPVRIRTEPWALMHRRETIGEALERAAGRALANSREVVLAPRGAQVRVAIASPEICWSGAGSGDVSLDVRRAVELLIRQALGRALDGAEVRTPARRRSARAPLQERAAERTALDRLDPSRGEYRLPAYDQPRDTTVPVDGPRAKSDEPDWQSIALGLESPDEMKATTAFYDLYALIEKWNTRAIATVMLGIRADGGPPTFLVLRLLGKLARQQPGRFRQLLRDLRAGYQSAHRATFFRGENDVTVTPQDASVDVPVLRQIASVIGGLIYVARAIPAARAVAAEWESEVHGLERVGALLSALAQSREALARYVMVPTGHPAARPLAPTRLAPRYEHPDPATLASIRGGTAVLQRYQGTILINGSADIAQLLQLDLVENIRWVDSVLQHVQSIDSTLQAMGTVYGPALDVLEEAKVLRGIRAGLLAEVGRTLMPTAKRAGELREAWDELVEDWIGVTADHRLASLRTNFARLATEVDNAQRIKFENYSVNNDKLIFSVSDYNWSIIRLWEFVQDLKPLIAADWTGVRDSTYLTHVSDLEEKASMASARLAIIFVWRSGVQIHHDVLKGDIGSSDEQREWLDQVESLHAEAQALYARPDLASIGDWVMKWRMRLDRMVDLIKDAIRRENNRRILVALAALVATAMTGGALAGLGFGAVTITIGEAFTMTAVQSVGTRFVVGKPVSVGDVVKQFGTNLITFGAFKILNVGLLAGAAKLFPEQAFVQFAVIFGGNLVVATGAPLLLGYIEHGKWPSDVSDFIVSGVVLTTMGMLIGAPDIMAQIRSRQLASIGVLNRVATDLEAIHLEARAISKIAQAGLETGTLTEDVWEVLQARMVKLADGASAALRRLAANDITDEQLAAFGMTRDQALDLADLTEAYGGFVKFAKYPGRAGAGPRDIIDEEGLVVSNGRVVYEPGPSDERSVALVRKFRAAGYEVREDAGVIRVLKPGEDAPRVLLLPAGMREPAAPLARLVTPPGKGAADVLASSRKFIAIGLRTVQTQTAVPSLEERLTNIAASDGQAASAILDGIARHVQPTNALALKSIAHFLEIEGNPRTLGVLLGLGDKYDKAAVGLAIGRLGTLRASDLPGVEAIAELYGKPLSDVTDLANVDRKATVDRIVGIMNGYDDPHAVFGALGVITPRTVGGLEPLVKGLANPDQAVRAQAEDVLRTSLDLVVKGPRAIDVPGSQNAPPPPAMRLRFEQLDTGGLSVRDESLSAVRGLRSYSDAELDAIVDQTGDIRRIREIGLGMVQGSSGALFEKWGVKYLIHSSLKPLNVRRLVVPQDRNPHLDLMGTERRLSDSFLTDGGEIIDMKFLLNRGHVDENQLMAYKAMLRAGYVIDADGVRHDIRTVSYWFQDRPAAVSNLFITDTPRDVRLWYVDDWGSLQQLR